MSLLIAELSFSDGTHQGAAKLGIMAATVVAAALGAAFLRWDARQARTADMNLDGMEDTDTRDLTEDPVDD